MKVSINEYSTLLCANSGRQVWRRGCSWWTKMWLAFVLWCFTGTCGHGEQRCISIPAGYWEDQEPLIPQPNVGHEHWEKAGVQQQKRGEWTHILYSLHIHKPLPCSWRQPTLMSSVCKKVNVNFRQFKASPNDHLSRTRLKNVDEQPPTKALFTRNKPVRASLTELRLSSLHCSSKA